MKEKYELSISDFSGFLALTKKKEECSSLHDLVFGILFSSYCFI